MSTQVLFVCLGNICRSPMAEFVLRDLTIRTGLDHMIQVASAGTSGWHNGENMHSGTQAILKAHQINPSGFLSSQIQPDALNHYDHIIAMDDQNMAALKTILPTLPLNQVYKITDLIVDTKIHEVPDPYFSGNFEQTYDLIYQGCTNWLQQWQQYKPNKP